MHSRKIQAVRRSRGRKSRVGLLCGVSALALVMTGAPARAIPLGTMRGGSGAFAATANAAAAAMASVQQAQQATQQSMNDLNRAVQAVQAMQQAQTQARTLAQQSTSAVPGLPSVPNGLTPGGLVPVYGLGSYDAQNPDPNVWLGANAPTQSTSNGQTTVTVQQTTQKAILTWTSFNVGANTELYFNQSAGNSSTGNDWIVLNRVVDPSGVPSQILGQIKAEGTVYLINRNGIIFGGASQVNVSSLIASSLNFLGENLTNQSVPGSVAWDTPTPPPPDSTGYVPGTVADANKEFLTNGITDPANTNTPFLGSTKASLADVESDGNITVEAGAQIEAGNLGYALLAAPDVSNAGTILALGGQVILAAGMQLQLPIPSPEASNSWLSPMLEGFLGLGASDPTPVFTATNTGLIEATTGNVTILGAAINQAGVAEVTTSITRPGEIDLTAEDEVQGQIATSGRRTGPIVFAPGSVTAILPEEDGETTTSDQAANTSFKPGTISMTAGAVDFDSGALVEAPGANVSVTTAGSLALVSVDGDVPGRIYVDSGAVIDVSGMADVQLPVSDTLVTIGPLTADDLADSPLQRDGFLLGQTVLIDSSITGTRSDGEAWVGSPLIDAQGYVSDVPRTIDQMLVNAGTLSLNGGEVITAPGSVLNLTGGYIHYLGGTIATTRLIDASGNIVDIADADPDDTFVGFAGEFSIDHAHWGITDYYTTPLLLGGYYQPDYIQGGNGGALNIYAVDGYASFQTSASTGAMILDGEILASSEIGPHQVQGGNLPSGGSLTIGSNSSSATTQNFIIGDQATQLDAIAPDFNADTSLLTPADQAMALSDPSNVLYTSTISAPILDAAGFSSMSFSGSQNIAVNAALNVKPGGSISLDGGAVQVNADLTAPGGTIGIVGKSYFIELSPTGALPNLSFAGDVTVGAGVTISAAGQWVNDAGLGPYQQSGDANINGGSISITTEENSFQAFDNFAPLPPIDVTGAIDLERGSLLDVSSGGYVEPDGTIDAVGGIPVGKGGSISLQTYVFGNTPFGSAGGPLTPTDQPTRGTITLDGTLRGFGFSGGGTLTLQTLGIQIGGDPASAPSYDLVLPADFFSSQGFGAYNLTALYDATVTSGTVVTVSEKNFIPNADALLAAPSGTNLYGAGGALPDGSLVSVGSLDPYQRQAADFSLTAAGYLAWDAKDATVSQVVVTPVVYPGVSGTLLLGQDASILADAGAAVSLTSHGQLTDLGTIVAHGGSISLTGAPVGGTSLTSSVWLGADSVLDASGVTLLDPYATPVWTASGEIVPRTGNILDGGSVSVLDGFGYVIAEAGSIINVSGTANTFDTAQSGGGLDGIAYAPTPVWSNAGSITLGGVGGLLYDGTLVAHAGAPEADGGTLTLSAAAMAVPYSRVLTLPDGTEIPNTVADGIILQQSGTFVPAGLEPGDEITAGTLGYEQFAVDRLEGSGIDGLVIGGDPVAFSLSTAAPTDRPVAVGFAGSISISLGRSFISDATEYVALAAGATSISAGQTSVGGTTVSISAPYVDFGGAASGTPALAVADGSLAIHAGTLDLTGQIDLENFGNADFVSSGDTRLYTLSYGTTSIPDGELVTGGNLTFQAAQLYPATANTFIIDAVGQTVNGSQLPTTVTFLPGGAASSVPLSAGGSLLIDATNIVQDGTVRVPLGTLVLGVNDTTSQASEFNSLPLVATQSVTLGPGSITSVSLDGATVPYGTTVDGLDWQYQIYGPPSDNNTFSNLTAPPAKSISLAGSSVALDPGATVDLSGGGTIYAAEWVSGTGGSRNLLLQSNTVYQSASTPTQVPLYPDDRPIYAVIPGYNSPVAPVDQEMAPDGSAVGEQVYLSGVAGLPAGIYTLLPGQYATMPGAYRVVQQTGSVNAVASQNVVLPDGSGIAEGYFIDGLTGAHSAETTSFLVQSAAAWGQYSQYTITNANSYFASQAAEAGTAVPRLPQDAGQLALAASNALTFGATLQTQPGAGGQGALVDITSQDIQIVGNGEAALPGYLQIGADALDQLGAASLLIGGIRSQTSSGEAIDVGANSIVVSNDASDPLSGPEILLVTKTDPSNGDPNAPTGLLVESGSVIEAKGSSAETPETIIIGQDANSTTGAAAVSGDGALLAVSQNGILSIVRNDLPASSQGLLTIQGGVTLSGGAGLTLDASGNTLVDPTATLGGQAIAADSGLITFIPGSAAPGLSGMVIGPNTLAQLADADEVILRSYGAIDFEGNVNVDVANDLELSAGSFTSGAAGDAGDVSIHAGTLTLANDLGVAAPTSSVSGPGSLMLTADEIDFGSASQGASASAFSGFGSVSANATNGIVGQGLGTFNFGALSVTLTAPVIIAGADGNATLKTTGALVLNSAPAAGATSAAGAFGGAITLIGGAVSDNTLIQVLSGNVTLEATTGDLDVNDEINVSGFAKQFFDTAAYAPAGNITLTADAGTINVASDAALDFAGAQGGGAAGALTLSAPQGVVNLSGVLQGGAAAGYQGGSFTLNTGGAVDLDTLAATLASSGVNKLISVDTESGNLVLSANNSLTAANVSLTADGGGAPGAADGNVIIDGTINVSGPAAGEIGLYGKSGVDVEGTLLAISTTPAQVGGNVTIGTTGTPDGTLNTAYGYENVSSASSGTITIGPNAKIENWGGQYGISQSTMTIGLGDQNLQTQPNLGLAAGDTIDVIDRKNGDYMGGAVVSYNSTTGALVVNVTSASGAGFSDYAWSINGVGGVILLRAPLTEDGNVNIYISPGALFTAPSAVAIEPYAVWSTTDSGTTPAQQAGGSEHFDGIVDPAGWYDSNGNLVAGTWTDEDGNPLPAPTSAQLQTYLENDYFTPTNANADHTGFYGYQSDGTTPGTLMGFIENLPLSSAALASLQTFAQSNNLQGVLQVRPGIELVNPAASGVNSGNISVLTNWNLAAGASPTSLAYRYDFNGQIVAPVISILAGNDLKIDASITDGFYQQNPGATLAPSPPNYGSELSAYNTAVSYLDDDAILSSDDPLWQSGTIYEASNGFNGTKITSDPYWQAVQAPSPGQSDAYYLNYSLYIADVGNGSSNSWAADYNTGDFEGYQPYTPNAVASVPNPASFGTYAAYAAYYQSWLTNNFNDGNITTATPPPLLAPGEAVGSAPPDSLPNGYANYDAYSTDYKLYAQDYPAYYTYVYGYATGTAYSSGPQLFYAPFAPVGDAGNGAVGNNTPSNMPSLDDPAAFASATLLGGSSSSYRIVAGADLASANPLAVSTGSDGSIDLGGHFAVVDSASQNAPDGDITGRTLLFPTTVRTGTGSIDIAAAGDVDWTDSAAPASVYTAGEPAPGTTADTSVSLLQPPTTSVFQGELLVTGPVMPVDAGDISISAGGNINGIEQVYDTTGAVTGTAGTYIAQFWWQWMETGNVTNSSGQVTQSSINFAAFDQGVMSAGGNVTVKANGNIDELSVSLPTTWNISNGVVNTLGGGNLSVTAGGDILSGTYFVANGTGSLTAGGEIASDFNLSTTVEGTTGGVDVTTSMAPLLGYQNTNWTVTARQNADIGGVYDPSYFKLSEMTQGDFQSPSSNSSLSILSTGSAELDTMTASGAAFLGSSVDGVLLPASLNITALGGSIQIDNSGELYPSVNGQLTLLADQSISFANESAGGSVYQEYFGLIDTAPSSLPTPTKPEPVSYSGSTDADPLQPTPSGTERFQHTISHAQNDNPARIYALNGNIIDGTEDSLGFYYNELTLEPNKPTFIQAGNDIVNLSFLGENFYASDVTKVVAGRDIYDPILGRAAFIDPSWALYLTPALELAGPGYFDVQAGRNIGPLTSANLANQVESFGLQPGASGAQTGIETIGDLDNAALPDESASISILFGVSKGINDTGFADAYIDPMAAAIPGITSLTPDLVSYVEQIERDQLTRAGESGTINQLTPEQAWAVFQTLPQYQQQAFIDQAFFNVLTQVGADYNNSASPYYHQYARGYEAINTLFPASYGYTQNNLNGGTNGANSLVSTGYFDMRGATVQTQEGGNVNILGPGGEILVGSASAPPFVVNANGDVVVGPNQQGILTLETGDVDIFSDQSLLLAQSRIFTEQGGDMTIWSSNGDINAGEGAKTTSAVPPPEFKEDPDAYFTVDAKSQVTGAGIATLQTIPSAPRGNVYLIAPRGTVDAGAAGIRVSGNLDIAALQVLNAFNIQVQGVTEGVPTVAAPNIGALDSASSASGAATKAITAVGQGNNAPAPASILIVEIEGYGGDDGESAPVQQPQPDQRRKSDGQHASYDPNGNVQILGYSKLDETDMLGLTDTEKRAIRN
ncbi:MAG: filamentous hemagglutinin family protein [Pseudomonadota bacterium]